ncbi:MAG: PD-(D/E)XK nuclease family protein [Chthonomonadaceae bacterium]|nr:PD-(D/E)XK nuclease family protein [Chthonomonadaceae bacterium]
MDSTCHNELKLPKKPTLSPTKLTTFLACPTMYYWTYMDDRGRWYARSKSYYSFGTSLHSVLQRFHDKGDTGVETVESAVAALEESWIQAGYANQDDMNQALGEGKAIIEKYVDDFARKPVTAETVFIEKQFRMDMGEFDLIGRLDRVDEHADGTIEVIDYKSGRGGVTEEDVAQDTAMGCYQLLLRNRFPGQRVIATIIALRTGEQASSGFDDSEARKFHDDVRLLGEHIVRYEFEGHVPTKKPLCEGCDFLPLCQKAPGYG